MEMSATHCHCRNDARSVACLYSSPAPALPCPACCLVASVDANSGLLTNFEVLEHIKQSPSEPSTEDSSHRAAAPACSLSTVPSVHRSSVARSRRDAAQAAELGAVPTADGGIERFESDRLLQLAACSLSIRGVSQLSADFSLLAAAAIANRPEDEAEESERATHGCAIFAALCALLPHVVSPLSTESAPTDNARVPSVSSPVPADISRVEAWRLQSILAPLGPAVWLHHNVASFLSRYPPATQSAARIRSTLSSLQSLQRRQQVAQLTNSELLQLINLRPLTLVEVHRIVEECEERMGEQEVLALLDCIREGLPDGPMQRKRDEAEDDTAAAEG